MQTLLKFPKVLDLADRRLRRNQARAWRNIKKLPQSKQGKQTADTKRSAVEQVKGLAILLTRKTYRQR